MGVNEVKTVNERRFFKRQTCDEEVLDPIL